MKTEEDEAFDDLAKKQGDWGGGFKAKRAAAADKTQEPAQESWREFASDYERGFIDGMQKQAQSSVDKAVNRMAQPTQELQVRTGDCLLVGVCASEGHKIQAQRPWVGLTVEEIEAGIKQSWVTKQAFQSAAWWAEAKLKEKNT